MNGILWYAFFTSVFFLINTMFMKLIQAVVACSRFPLQTASP